MAVKEISVVIVDDDADLCEALAALIKAEGIAVKTYPSAAALLSVLKPEMQGCLILDLNLPEISGLELQQILLDRGVRMPIVFLTGYGDVPASTTAFKAGAVHFLEKPVDSELLLHTVREALDLAVERRAATARQQEIEELYGQLTPREKEIIVLVARGYSAKQVGRALNISHRTAEIHRARIMEKLGSRSVADLVAITMDMGRALTAFSLGRRRMEPKDDP